MNILGSTRRGFPLRVLLASWPPAGSSFTLPMAAVSIFNGVRRESAPSVRSWRSLEEQENEARRMGDHGSRSPTDRCRTCRVVPPGGVARGAGASGTRGGACPSTSGGNRTLNRRFWKPVLCQLSYARLRFRAGATIVRPAGLRSLEWTKFRRIGRRMRPISPAVISSATPCAECASARGGRISSTPAGPHRGFPSGPGSSGPRKRCIPAKHTHA